MIIPDVYYLPEWLALYAPLDGEDHEYYVYECPEGTVLYPYVIRKAPYLVNGVQYFDIITPYGFNGPYAIGCEQENIKTLAAKFDTAFVAHCKENNIIAEYVRFSPWLHNCDVFGHLYALHENNQTVAINLDVPCIMMDELRSKRRNQVRLAQKFGVEVRFDFQGDTVSGFYSLYQNTIRKNSIGKYYDFSRSFLERHFAELAGHVFLANALVDNGLVSSCLVISQGEHLHYHLSANDYGMTKYQGNSLLLYELARWGKEHGYRYLHLGGVGVANKSLMDFKYSFTHNDGFLFPVGTRLHNKAAYDALIQLRGGANPAYFPEYRG